MHRALRGDTKQIDSHLFLMVAPALVTKK